MPLLWQVDLRDRLRLQGSAASPPPVWAISFSPDERSITIGIGSSARARGAIGDLITVPIDHPDVTLDQFEVVTRRFDSVGNAPPGYLNWLAGGDALMIGDQILLRRTAGICKFEGAREVFDGGLDLASNLTNTEGGETRDLSVARIVYRGVKPNQLEIGSLDCQQLARVVVPGNWTLAATSPNLHLIALQSLPLYKSDHQPAYLRLFDTRTLTEVRRIEIRQGVLSWVRFAEQGGSICRAFRDANLNSELECWDVSTGAKSGAPPALMSGEFSTGGQRVALSEYRRSTVFDLESFKLIPALVFKDRVIWDYTSQRILARWVPRKQKSALHGHDAFALSPSGRLYAEGGSGRVSLYRVD